MAGGVVVNGSVENVPGIYAVPGRSTIGGNTTSRGNMAVCGSFPSLEQGVPSTFTNKASLRALDPTNLDWARFADICWNPASDDRVGGVSSLTIVNAQPCTQAAYTFPSAASGDSVVFKARRWGSKGNATYVRITSKGSKTVKVQVSANGTSETYDSLTSGEVVAFDNSSCTDLTSGGTSTISIDNDGVTMDGSSEGICNRLVWAWTKVLQTVSGTPGLFTKLVVSGKVAAVIHGGDAAHTVTVTAVGLDATGDALTAAYVFTNPADGASHNLQVGGVDAVFSRLDSLTWTSTGGGYTAPTISANAFALGLTPGNGFTHVSDLAAYINNYSDKGWKLTVKQPQIAGIPANQLDKRTSIDTLSAVAPFRADVWALLAALAASRLVTCERATGASTSGVDMPYAWNASADLFAAYALIGGTETAVTVTSDYPDALASLETLDVQTAVVQSDDIDAGTALEEHLRLAALAGSERNGYFACPKDQTIDAVYDDYVTSLNSRNISVAAQEILMSNPLTGAKEYLVPFWQAVQMAAMQCGRNVGIPLTNKKPRILGTRQDWTVGTDDNEVIKKGIYAYTLGNKGYKVLRSITSWVSDDFVPYAEMSGNESFNFSIRDLRNQIEAKIGDPADIAPTQFVGVMKSVLDTQKANKEIRDYDPTSVHVAQVGDVYNLYARVAPMLPFNFGVVFMDAYTYTSAA